MKIHVVGPPGWEDGAFCKGGDLRIPTLSFLTMILILILGITLMYDAYHDAYLYLMLVNETPREPNSGAQTEYPLK